MPLLGLGFLSTELFILAFNPLNSELLLCKLVGNWYFVVLYFLGIVVDFSSVGIQSPICIFYLNFINCSILALLFTAVTCFLSLICKCCKSNIIIKTTDRSFCLFENFVYFFIVSFELVPDPDPILSKYL